MPAYQGCSRKRLLNKCLSSWAVNSMSSMHTFATDILLLWALQQCWKCSTASSIFAMYSNCTSDFWSKLCYKFTKLHFFPNVNNIGQYLTQCIFKFLWYEWVNVSSGTGSPGLSQTEFREPYILFCICGPYKNYRMLNVHCVCFGQ